MKRNAPLARKAVLPTFTFFEVVDQSDPNAIAITTAPTAEHPHGLAYYTRPANLDGDVGADALEFERVPVVLDATGAPWEEAAIVLLNRLGLLRNRAEIQTLHSLADDFVAFKRFVDESGGDFAVFPKNKSNRPTYRYRRYVTEAIEARVIAQSTGKRRVGRMVFLYRKMIELELLAPEHPPWEEREFRLHIEDRYGLTRVHTVASTDLSISAAAVDDPSGDTILEDGRRLRPLTREEQEALLAALEECDNVAMTLIHLIGIFTGARIQTILTLRLKHFSNVPKAGPLVIVVGNATLADTKKGKKHQLYLPQWLWEKVCTYIKSPRAKELQKRAGGTHPAQYVFLTNR